MTSFWTLAARDWPPAYPVHQLVEVVGADAVASLVGSGVLREEAIRPWATVPCSTCRADARVIYEPSGAVAVCTGDSECPTESLGVAPARAVMDAGDFARRLAAAFGLDGVPGAEGLVSPLGRRFLGEEQVAVDLCAHPRRDGVLAELQRLSRSGPSVRVVLVPDPRLLPADAPDEAGIAEIVWLGLDEVLVVDGEMRVDLGPLLARRPFRGLVHEQPFAGLLLSEEGVRWRGRTVALSPLTTRLLRLLAAHPGELHSRASLWFAMWPEEHTRTGQLGRGVNPDDLDRRLRKSVADIRAALGEGVVENRRGDERSGGYRLALAPSQVREA